MVRSLGRLTLAVIVCLALAAACGSDDGTKRVAAGDAGEAGAAGQPTKGIGGSESRAGAPAVIEAGAGGVDGGAGGVPSGMAGAPALGGQGGQVSLPDGGESGVAGQPQVACCEPLTCADQVPGNCGNIGVDPCTGTQTYCGCAIDEECVEGGCQACNDPEPCTDNQALCGNTFDKCGNPITCPDNCSSQTSGGVCRDGSCCGAEFQCHLGDCGPKDDGCGGILDCTDFTECEGTDTCQPNGTCCTPTNGCGTGVCGLVYDGCGGYVDCGDPCVGDFACLDGSCRFSECKDSEYECGTVFNVELDGDEHCGTCAEGSACISHACVPLCGENG